MSSQDVQIVLNLKRGIKHGGLINLACGNFCNCRDFIVWHIKTKKLGQRCRWCSQKLKKIDKRR